MKNYYIEPCNKIKNVKHTQLDDAINLKASAFRMRELFQ